MKAGSSRLFLWPVPLIVHVNFVNLKVGKIMKWPVLFLLCFALTTGAQCTYSCSSYVVSPIQFSMYPAAGTQIFLMDDDVTTTLPLNFNFDFYCNTYNQVRVCSNGFITFDFGPINTANTPYAQNMPSTLTPNAVIAFNWNDLDPSVQTGSGTITYTTIGVSPDQKFIVTYSAVPIWTNNMAPSQLLNTGQIILHETSNIIEIQVKEASSNGWLTHTEGIEDATASTGTAVPGRNLTLWTATNSAHMFSPFQITASVSATGSSSLCYGASGQYSALANPPPDYYTWIFPSGWSSSGNSPTVNATAGAAGVVSVVANYSCGASFPATVQVSVAPSPTIGFSTVSPTNLCGGHPFNVGAKGAATYTLQPGSFGTSQSFTAQASSSQIFSLSGTSSVGCNAVNTATVFISIKPAPTVAVNSGTICLGETFTITPSGAFSYNYLNGFQYMSPTSPGSYSVYVVGTGTNMCKGPPVLSSLLVNALPAVTVTPARNLICRGENVKLTAKGSQSFFWFHDSTVMHEVVVTPSLMTTYTVEGTDVNGCKNTSKVSVLVSSCVGIEQPKDEIQEIRVFPNPSAGLFNLQLGAAGAEIRIVDITGQTVLHRFEAQEVCSLDLKQGLPGIYFLLVTGDTYRETRILIKQ
jgi:hypothetical protein